MAFDRWTGTSAIMNASEGPSENAVGIAAEDKFLIFSFGSGRHLCPHSNHADHLAEMIFKMPAPLDKIVPVFDLRGTEGYYADIDTFIRSVGGDNPCVLLGEAEIEAGWDRMLRRQGIKPMHIRGQSFTAELLDVDYFDCEAEAYREGVLESMEPGEALSLGYDVLTEMGYDLQREHLFDFLTTIHRNSLLVEFVMTFRRDRIEIAPYHAHAVHNVETSRDSILVSRPGVIAHTTRAVFSLQIHQLEQLINNPDTKERHLQTFLEQNPEFLRGLNYQNIYPQIVLERGSDGCLIPDFILEPYDDAFCDILDIKLPSQRLVVGRKDRAMLAMGIHEVAAQLREYAAYFESPKYRQYVQQKYGLRVYRPRLIAVVGRDLKQMGEEQLRRAMTEYHNLQFMTFDELLKHARNRMLV
jgi:hypothetical protein